MKPILPDDYADPLLRRLIASHPLLFRSKKRIAQLEFRSHLPAGWFPIFDKLCTDIENVLGPEDCKKFNVEQIKEKFGTLRFYYKLGGRADVHVDLISNDIAQHFATERGKDDASVRVRELVDAACARTSWVCLKCGSWGRTDSAGGWLATLCDEHMAESRKRMRPRNKQRRINRDHGIW